MSESYTVFHTTWGWMGIVYGTFGIKGVFLPLPRKKALTGHVQAAFRHAVPGSDDLSSSVAALQDYFRAGRLSFSVDLDWRGYSPFTVAVWKAAQTIPRGSTGTYQWLSDQVGRKEAQRAVGGALGRNPFPLIVPCHRVVRSDGALGGFSAPGGIALKRKLLEHEGVVFDGKGRVLAER